MTVDKGIFIKNIYYMLSYAFDIKRLRKEDYKRAAGEEFENIYDLFAAILEKGVSQQIKQGLYREYVPMQEELSVMRGKPDISETMRLRVQRKQKLACRFDEFSQDNLYNQILKITLYLLARADGVTEERKQALRRLSVYFGDVSLIQPRNIAWDRIMYQRGNRGYELLLNICRLVITGLLQTTEDGSYKLLSFTDENMAKLYEKFILEYYKYHHPELDPRSSLIPWALDDGRGDMLPSMQSDIMLKNKSSNAILIIDAKYYSRTTQSQYGVHTLHSNNLYQIFTYVKNKDAILADKPHKVSGMLLYAATDESIQPDNTYFMSGNKITVKTLDLNRDFSGIQARLEQIAQEYFPLQT